MCNRRSTTDLYLCFLPNCSISQWPSFRLLKMFQSVHHVPSVSSSYLQTSLLCFQKDYIKHSKQLPWETDISHQFLANMSGSSIYSPFSFPNAYSIVCLKRFSPFQCLLKESMSSVNIWKAIPSKWYSMTTFSCFGYASHTKILLYWIIILQTRLPGPGMRRVEFVR